MARIRTIKPEFWSDDTITECSLSARLLFIGIWNFADDAGNLDRSHKQIKARVFPVDNVNCEPLLQELMTHGLLIEYSVSGQKYLHIPGFAKHQLINRPSNPQVPSYDDSLRTHGTLTEGSMSTHAGLEGKGREGIKKLPTEAMSDDAQQDQGTDPCKAIFEHWQQVHHHPDSRLTESRRKVIRKALKDYTADQLCESIAGYLNSPHHMGQNDRGTRYDSLELLLRDAARIDAGLQFARMPPKPAETKYDEMIRLNGGRTVDPANPTQEQPRGLLARALAGR